VSPPIPETSTAETEPSALAASEAAASDLPRGVADRLALLIHKLGTEVLVRAEEALGEIGLSGRQYMTLAVLEADAPVSQAELATMLRLLPAQVVPVLDELERAGLAKRERSTSDRRRFAVRVTPKGRRRLARADALAASIEDELLGHLDKDARARLHDALRQALAPAWPVKGGAPGARDPAA
jgi:DNA-binding MarR family transcriptional regulator